VTPTAAPRAADLLALNYALAGLALGAIAALSGVGMIITYQVTGVFNIAQGALAMISAYVFWQIVTAWHVPTAIALVLVLFGFAPAVGVLVERVVFRPLKRRNASAAESLVATIGLTVLIVGIAYKVWGPQAQIAVNVLPDTVWHLGSLTVHADALTILAIVLLGTAGLGVVARRTALGTSIRAVVDRRDLAELAGVNADRVSAIGWATGVFVAALTGILLAPEVQFTPFQLTLVVLETIAVPVIAGLSSVPIAIIAGLALGIGASEMSLFNPTGPALGIWNALEANLPVVALLVALLVRTHFAESGGDAGTTRSFARRRSTEHSPRRRVAMYAIATVALLSPLLFSDENLRQAQQVPALAVIFVSIVAVTGYSGQISLGQAGYAGLGALLFGRFSTDTPELAALLCAALAAGIVGFLTGYPAIRRRGLFLALTTFAVGAFVSRFVFQQPYFTNGLEVTRPSLFGLSLSGDRAFYGFELVVLGLVFLVMTNLRDGPLGRALVAMRDSENGARSVGVDVRTLKIFIFTVSAVIAGIGGALLVQQAGAFSPDTFDPLASSIPWFAVVVVFGADSAAGAVLGAALVVLINSVTGNPEAYQIIIGVFATFIGLLPGGVAEASRRVVEWLAHPAALVRRYERSLPLRAAPVVLSGHGLLVRERIRARRRAEAAQ
jgi:branched-chain amino acid transport system permease protein